MRARPELWAALLAERDRAERVARARCRSHQDAEDCVQEAMARVAAMPNVDLARIGPLISTVVAHLAVDTHRRAARQQRAEPRLGVLVRHEPSPEEQVCDVHEARWLQKSAASLPSQDRAVLEARAAGHSAREAADLLELSYKAAESSFTRARAKMQAIWRSTAAAIGILWAAHTRRPRAAVTAGALATAAVMLLMPWVSVPGDAAPRTPATPSSGWPEPPQVDRGAARDDSVAGPSEAPVRARASAPPSSPSTTPILSTPPLANPAAQGFATTVTRERADESLADTLERCVREGVHLSVTQIGCRG